MVEDLILTGNLNCGTKMLSEAWVKKNEKFVVSMVTGGHAWAERSRSQVIGAPV